MAVRKIVVGEQTWATVSAMVVLIVPPVVLAYDVVISRVIGPGATITAVIQRWQTQIPELPWVSLAMGVWLWAHLYLAALLRANLPPPPAPPL